MKNANKESGALISGISRHRLATDGEGVTTLVGFHGCPLCCGYCLNPHTLKDPSKCRVYTPLDLYAEARLDEIYFLATNGGITFGGGESALHHDFIADFRELCGTDWRITLETSLNVPVEAIESLSNIVDEFIIDIKDMNPETYRRYTGRSNERVRQNLGLLAARGRAGDCLIRIPLIPGFNSENDRKNSIDELKSIGFSRFDLFTYITRINPLWHEENTPAKS